MAKFDRKGRAPARKRDEEGEKKSGRSAYKAKRSFTRNKSYRDKEKEGDTKSRFRKPAFRDRDKDTDSKGKPFREKRTGYRDRDDGKERSERRTPFREKRSGYRDGEGAKERGEKKTPFREKRTGYRDREEGKERGERSTPFRENTPYRDRPFRGRDDKKIEGPSRKRFEREDRDEDRPRRGSDERGEESKRKTFRERPDRRRDEDTGTEEQRPQSKRAGRRPFGKDRDREEPRRVKHEEFEGGRSFRPQERTRTSPPKKTSDDGLIRLNKYLSNSGIASRREADELIQSGAVKVNGVVVDQLGYKIKPTDTVTYGDAPVRGERKVYLLLNKPKDYITTVEDPRDRKTVMELIRGACRERVYPVGRLDRNTTGLLLLTNDGDLTTKLTHPKYGVKKVYHVTLDKNLKTTDFKALVDGVELEDGPAKADDLAFVGEGKRDVGIEIHSGRNRIVRRMFEQLGYKVVKLDRVVFAGLTKKDLPRGKHRFLTSKEVSFLKMIG